MADGRGRHLVGVHEPLDLGLADWTRRADELRHPLLVIHSDADDFVPIDAPAQLARLRPDLVRFERWRVAGHCREWNTDPVRWENALAGFLSDG
jgi:pimeloyl-ACP methyl ester carboxylesterase